MKYYSDMLPDEYKNIKLCVLVPCYNEAESIEAFYAGLLKNIEKYNYTVLFIDDGSIDRTIYKLQALAALDHRLSYISLSRNFGQQHALKAGYDHIQDADCVVSMDADLQHPPEYIEKLIQKWLAGYEVVNTIRQNNHKIPYFKQLTAKCFYKLINYISENKIITNGPDYRLLDKKVVKAIQTIRESNLYLKELIPWVGFRQCTVYFEVSNRCNGKSKYPLKKTSSAGDYRHYLIQHQSAQAGFSDRRCFFPAVLSVWLLCDLCLLVYPQCRYRMDIAYCKLPIYRRLAISDDRHYGRIHRKNISGNKEKALIYNK